ncbi:MAG TPA: adenylyl-sulfate kinase [Thermoanaerobaculia bacterium]
MIRNTNGTRGAVVWLTGLSGSGKTTTARALAVKLTEAGHAAYVLDGDRLRQGLNSDLGFSPADRAENIRRAGEVAALLADAGIIAIAAFISPYRDGRDKARKAAGPERFFEIYVDTPMEECERRDVKGLYGRARTGEIADFTGISAPYEPPLAPDLHIGGGSVEESVDRIAALLAERGVIA